MNTVFRFPRIAIVKLSSFGDILHALPVAVTLKKQFKQCHITWITEKLGSQLLEDNPSIDDVIIINTKVWRKWLKNPVRYPALAGEIGSCINALRSTRYDAVVDLQGLLKSGVFLRLLKSEERWGFPPHRCREPVNARFSNRYISDSLLQGHIIEQNLSFAFLMGCRQTVTKLKFPCTRKEKHYIDTFIRQIPTYKMKVIVNPGAGWKTKIWPPEKYGKVCEYLYDELNTIPILTWGPGEESLIDTILDTSGNKAVRAPATNLRQLAYLIRNSSFIIGGDTGPIHLAAAQDVPVVAIIGPSDPVRNGPWGKLHETVYHEMECSGCYKRECKDSSCITGIKTEEVLAAVKKMIDKCF